MDHSLAKSFTPSGIESRRCRLNDKRKRPEHLIDSCAKSYRGRRYITRPAEILAASVAGGVERPPHEMLSDREHQVLCMIASGKTVGQIADELSLSVTTISTYRARVLEKMGMKTNAELTHYAISNKLVW